MLSERRENHLVPRPGNQVRYLRCCKLEKLRPDVVEQRNRKRETAGEFTSCFDEGGR